MTCLLCLSLAQSKEHNLFKSIFFNQKEINLKIYMHRSLLFAFHPAGESTLIPGFNVAGNNSHVKSKKQAVSGSGAENTQSLKLERKVIHLTASQGRCSCFYFSLSPETPQPLRFDIMYPLVCIYVTKLCLNHTLGTQLSYKDSVWIRNNNRVTCRWPPTIRYYVPVSVHIYHEALP